MLFGIHLPDEIRQKGLLHSEGKRGVQKSRQNLFCWRRSAVHGDRRFADDRALIGGFAKLDGKPVMLLATQKGRILKEKLECNFGSANPEG
ncbi:MAG: hypothetical protein IKN50_06915, partial [Clostridia bacterium]|nr:hypothetical protein [Clostridia bacterium]